MEKFTRLASVAAPLPEADIDTDVIFPARFLLLLDRAGLAQCLFHERRQKGVSEQKPFVLDAPPFDKAAILVAGPNFGSGSSREQAVWALADFGIRCVIAPSLGEIFHFNCFRNAVLPVVLPPAEHARVMAAAERGAVVTVDLEAQEVRLEGEAAIGFTIDPYRRRALLLGQDDIGAILADDAAAIEDFEARQRAETPWLHLSAEQLSIFARPAGGNGSV
jgi:3-isopropylmalate/(R)-2-methylmalate dehydratase small subunit